MVKSRCAGVRDQGPHSTRRGPNALGTHLRELTFAMRVAKEADADIADIRFRHFTGAAFFSGRSTFFAALQPLSPNRPLKANLRCEIQSTLSPRAASSIEERINWTYAHAAIAETACCRWDSLCQIPGILQMGGRPEMQIAHRQLSRSRKRLIATGSPILFCAGIHLCASGRSD
ncbi:hypothetical protein SAMN04488118_1232 [Epibacterium ulvae]|uniref:Uncharacterized protein n=1 Tax=Epibacterium ulvae TaxID=1156985 RepID=A0A1G5RLR3_9RHOB|nr:hypothetical protein SAMN04488118_1232 [Epibacterium ulvae]